jgi:hypothetical protein
VKACEKQPQFLSPITVLVRLRAKKPRKATGAARRDPRDHRPDGSQSPRRHFASITAIRKAREVHTLVSGNGDANSS